MQRAFDEFLGADVKFEFDVVLRDGVGALGFGEMSPHECSDGTRGADCGGFGPFKILFDVHFSLRSTLFPGLRQFDFVPLEAPGVLIEVNIVVSPFEFAALKIHII